MTVIRTKGQTDIRKASGLFKVQMYQEPHSTNWQAHGYPKTPTVHSFVADLGPNHLHRFKKLSVLLFNVLVVPWNKEAWANTVTLVR